jgi:hypothetical protein
MRLQSLKDYIGLIKSRMPQTAPESGYYINSLPGINLKNIDASADNEQQNYASVWSDVQDRALDKLSLDAALRFAERYRIKTINRSLNIGKKINIHVPIDPAIGYRGFSIETTFKNNFSLVYSNLQTLSIVSLQLYLHLVPGTDVSIIIADMDTGETVDTLRLPMPLSDGTPSW